MTAHSPGDHIPTLDRPAFPALAVLAMVGAAVAFAGAGAAIRYLGGKPVGMVAGAIVMTAASACLVLPASRPLALLLSWNSLGIAAGLLLVTISSVGALMAFPMALIALALSAWPRRSNEGIVSGPAIAVLTAGFLLPFVLYGLPGNPASWFSALT